MSSTPSRGRQHNGVVVWSRRSIQPARPRRRRESAPDTLVDVCTGEYFIDFVAKKQTNCRTGKARDIRCAPAGSAVPASKPSEAGGTWQVLLNDGWKVMDAPTSATLSQAAKAGQTTVQLRQRGYDYTVDLAALTQTNLATKAVRQIKFV